MAVIKLAKELVPLCPDSVSEELSRHQMGQEQRYDKYPWKK